MRVQPKWGLSVRLFRNIVGVIRRRTGRNGSVNYTSFFISTSKHPIQFTLQGTNLNARTSSGLRWAAAIPLRDYADG